MTFDLSVWKERIQERLRGWRERMQDSGVNSLYGFLCTMTLWPVAEAARAGNWTALVALGNLLAGLGTNLVAARIQTWEDENDGADQIAEDARTDPALKAELDAVLEKLGALEAARDALTESDRNWFAETLSRELDSLDNLDRFEASVVGSGAVAQGAGAAAAGERGVVISGSVYGNVDVRTGDKKAEPASRKKRADHDLAAATQQYLSHLADRYQYLGFKGMGVSDRIPLRLPLIDMYVPLKARIEMPEGETWDRQLRVAGREIGEEEGVGRGLGEPTDLSGLLRGNDGLIILGDPGAGKTTFLKYLTLRLATGQGEGLGLGGRLPVLLPLSAYAAALAEKDIPLDDFIRRYYRNRGVHLLTKPMLAHALDQGTALLLLDGLDEVKEHGQRHLVIERVVDFFTVQRQKESKFVVTSRIVGYREVRPVVEGLAECTLVDFEDDEIEQFVGKWTAAVERAARGDSPAASRDAQQEREELLTAVRLNPGVQRMASNPLLLTILALMKRQGVTLPERRVELYENYVQTLLKHWNLARGLGGRTGPDLDVVETVRVLAPLALWMHETSPGVGLAKSEDVNRKLQEIYTARGVADSETAAHQLLTDVRDHTSLLLERGPGTYGFIHLTFQEYLAAVAIVQKGQADVDPVVEMLRSHVGNDNWHEVTLLTIGNMGLIQQRDKAASAVLDRLVEAAPGEPGEALDLAGQATVDVWPGGVTAQCRDTLAAQLRDAMRDDSRVSAAQRGACGRTLAKLGDPRPEATTLEDMQFCLVPPGPFWMGEGEEAHLNEVLTQPYWIGRYPVTNAQFREFIDAKGYQHEEYWPEAQEAGFWKNGMVKGRYEDEPRPGPMSFDEPFDLANHPVVGLSWYECQAFARWLADRWRDEGTLPRDWQVCLPSEAEWEKAARGGKQVPREAVTTCIGRTPLGQVSVDCCRNARSKRIYPWGRSAKADQADPNRANYRDTGIATSSAVGCFPTGASPYGCEDMAGNVWEWTGRLGEHYPYPQVEDRRNEREDTPASPDRLRVLRGGAFSYFGTYLRCAARRRGYPYNRGGSLGFRLCVCPHF